MAFAYVPVRRLWLTFRSINIYVAAGTPYRPRPREAANAPGGSVGATVGLAVGGLAVGVPVACAIAPTNHASGCRERRAVPMPVHLPTRAVSYPLRACVRMGVGCIAPCLLPSRAALLTRVPLRARVCTHLSRLGAFLSCSVRCATSLRRRTASGHCPCTALRWIAECDTCMGRRDRTLLASHPRS